MKRFYYHVLIAGLALLSLSSCEFHPILNLSRNDLSFHYQGGEADVILTVNKEWSVVSSAPWCSISSMGGQSAGLLTVCVKRNDGPVSRSCELKFFSDGLENVLTVKQGGSEDDK